MRHPPFRGIDRILLSSLLCGGSDLGEQKGGSLWFGQSRNTFDGSFTIDPRLDSLAGEVLGRSVFVHAQPMEENGHAESEETAEFEMD